MVKHIDKFDLNTFDKIIDDDLANMDFGAVHSVMETLSHEWFIGDLRSDDDLDNKEMYVIPSETMLYRKARERLVECYKSMVENQSEFCSMSSGGLRVQTHFDREDGRYWGEIMYCPIESVI